MGFLQGTDTYSLTQRYAVSCLPTGCLHMHLHQPYSRARITGKHTSYSLSHSHTHTHLLSIVPAIRQTQGAGWQEIRAEVSEGWKEVQPKMKETSIVSVLAGLWATTSS